MLISLEQIKKSIGAKTLYRGLDLVIQPGEKLGLIGRNGIGKTTLLHIISGDDEQFEGQISRRRGLRIVATSQEHHAVAGETAATYLLANLPDYARLKHIIDTYPETMGEDMAKIEAYTDALTQFGEKGYYEIEERVLRELERLGLAADLARAPLGSLSGGQKRLVELAKVTLADADLALIDEPTNHMDYEAKAAFIAWLEDVTHAVLVITHDRDVLESVDRIVEVSESGAQSFPGNYAAYLKQNSTATLSAVDQYEHAQKALAKLKSQINAARAKKAGSGDPKFKILEDRLQRQYDELAARQERPDFWIDREALSGMQARQTASYDKYKSRNIRLGGKGADAGLQRELLRVEDLRLGYGQPLFSAVSFALKTGERLRLHGRNGAGKTTLVEEIMARYGGRRSQARSFGGEIAFGSKVRIGRYEQEIDPRYLSRPLGAAITEVYREADLPFNDQKLRQILSDYLFDPMQDGRLELSRLSGGQKARFQLIRMLAGEPNLLILDEPTNHLDLPSIEELEVALQAYPGAVLYISHDSHFAANMGGETVTVSAVPAAAGIPRP